MVITYVSPYTFEVGLSFQKGPDTSFSLTFREYMNKKFLHVPLGSLFKPSDKGIETIVKKAQEISELYINANPTFLLPTWTVKQQDTPVIDIEPPDKFWVPETPDTNTNVD